MLMNILITFYLTNEVPIMNSVKHIPVPETNTMKGMKHLVQFHSVALVILLAISCHT